MGVTTEVAGDLSRCEETWIKDVTGKILIIKYGTLLQKGSVL
jgi:hypothetical protein